jgi:hypothetical protein
VEKSSSFDIDDNLGYIPDPNIDNIDKIGKNMVT